MSNLVISRVFEPLSITPPSTPEEGLLSSAPVEGPIKNLTTELIKRIIIFTDYRNNPNTLLVNRTWQAVTLACKAPFKDLKQLIHLLTPNLDQKKHTRAIEDLTRLEGTLQSLSCFMDHPSEISQLFTKTKTDIVSILKKLHLRELFLLRSAVCSQAPNSLKDIFTLTELALDDAILTGDYNTFYMVFQASLPLPEIELRDGVMSAAATRQAQVLRVLLAESPISQSTRGLALVETAKQNYIEGAQILLSDGSISGNAGKFAFINAAEHKNREFVELIADHVPSLEQDFVDAVIDAIEHKKNLKLKVLLKTLIPMNETARGKAVLDAIEQSDEEHVELLLSSGTISEDDTDIALHKAVKINRNIFKFITSDYSRKKTSE